MVRFIIRELSLHNISPGTTSVILWPRFYVFLAGYILILLVILLDVYYFMKINRQVFSNKRKTSSFLLSIISYFFFIWSYLFSFLIGGTNLHYHPYNNEIVRIPFAILDIVFFCIFVSSYIWLIVSYRKEITQETPSKTLIFESPIWFQIVFSIGIFVFLPFYYILYNSLLLKTEHTLKDHLLIKIRSLSKLVITYSVFAFVNLLIGVSFLLNTNLHGPFRYLNNKGFFFSFLSIGLIFISGAFLTQFLLNRILKKYTSEYK